MFSSGFSECVHCTSCPEIANIVPYYFERICKHSQSNVMGHTDSNIDEVYFKKIGERGIGRPVNLETVCKILWAKRKIT
jgi:hypothetical protein